MTCYICKATKDTRPYGKFGQLICFDCMTASKETEREAKRQFDGQINRIGATVVVIGSGRGPRAATYEEAVMVEDIFDDARKVKP